MMQCSQWTQIQTFINGVSQRQLIQVSSQGYLCSIKKPISYLSLGTKGSVTNLTIL